VPYVVASFDLPRQQVVIHPGHSMVDAHPPFALRERRGRDVENRDVDITSREKAVDEI
jgi:hypothetical protein